MDFDIVNKSETCQECGQKAPQRQIDNLEMCERCYLENKNTQQNQTHRPKNDLINQWRN